MQPRHSLHLDGDSFTGEPPFRPHRHAIDLDRAGQHLPGSSTTASISGPRQRTRPPHKDLRIQALQRQATRPISAMNENLVPLSKADEETSKCESPTLRSISSPVTAAPCLTNGGETLERGPRTLVYLMDGTWMAAEQMDPSGWARWGDGVLTNPNSSLQDKQKRYEMLEISKMESTPQSHQTVIFGLYVACRKFEKEQQKELISKYGSEERANWDHRQQSRYYPGVGTTEWNDSYVSYLTGGLMSAITGGNLEKIIVKMYLDIVADFQKGDEICLFGFSRGAYIVRILAQLIGHFGCERKNFNPESFFKTIREVIEHNNSEPLKTMHPKQTIKFMGCFDTVAGVGLPDQAIKPGHTMLGFLSSNVPSFVERAVHIFALDENNPALSLLTMEQPRWEAEKRIKPTFIQIGVQGRHTDGE
ncbi:hypothetical protein T439DRAFT_62795 [Meredithblackwellia eburnea MCA 4105]